MQRIARGWRLAVSSLEAIKQDPVLLVFPFLSLLALAVIGGLYLAAALSGSGMDHVSWITFIPIYFAASFIGIFSNATVMVAATMRFDGEKPTVGKALGVTAEKLPQILAWTALSTTVGLAIRAAEEKVPLVGRLALSLVGMAWGVLTFLVVPVLLFEELSVFAAIKRSVNLFRARWGEQLVGNASIGIMTFVFMVPVVMISMILVIVAWPIGLVFSVLSIGGLMLLSSAMQGVFNAALYRFATENEVVGAFSADDLGGAFSRRRKLFR